MNASELLANTLSPDQRTRQDAEVKLENASQENYPAYMMMLVAELVNDNSQPHIRNAAGLALKNAVSARDATRQQEYSNRWLALDAGVRTQIKQKALQALASPNSRVGQVGAQFVAAIAAVELPMGQWNDLIEILLGFMNDQANTPLRVATLQTIGYICESIKPEILALRSNEILTAVIHGARKEEPSAEVQLAAITALYNSLEFVRDNFEREGERNYIMQVVCEATQNPSVPVQVGAFECLVKIMTLYYDKMAFYMERALFGLTVMGMKHSEEAIALQAIEFWSTVCEAETELAWEAAEAHEFGEVPETESKFFAKVALPEILPVLLELLTHQEEDADEDEWNVSMAAGTCLGLLAQAVSDNIVAGVIPFIEAHIRSDNWHQREAAVMAFGSILDGPDPVLLNPLVNQALPILIDMMADQNVHVRDTVAWTLGRICELLSSAIKPDIHLHPLIAALIHGLNDNPRIVSNSCWALMQLADNLSYAEDEGQPPSPLAPYYDNVVQALLRTTETASNEGNYRTAAYEAITSYIQHATRETVSIVQSTALTILQRMEQLLAMQSQILGVDDRNNWNDLQSNFCSVLISAVRKLESGIQPLADRVMTLVLQLIQAAGKTSTVLEDAFLLVGAMANALEQHFAPYMNAFLPLLYPALKAHEDAQLCTVAIGVIGDLSRALGEQSAQFANAFMGVLVENLQSDILNRNVKITILSCFGDIALAIGSAFEPFLGTTMTVLRQAGGITPNPLDIELVEYVQQLREGILEAYTGIVGGLKNTDKVQLLLQHVPSILELVQKCLADSERTESIVKLAIGLVGDLADTFPNGEIKQYLLVEWLAAELRPRGRVSLDTKKTIRWAREVVKRATA
ncbi:ARM repeat-containing protein [Phanerochaete sordida]|uniref:Importin-95 n=1 Tax=Phanerochaete sordida TaxID=48140 RepID=A0A9P3LF44_9APHY|nr:ARM repeat-containing protein [Phanerochaete sordida]